jgi:NADPH:quinone reductase
MKAICVSEFADPEVLKLEDLPKRRSTQSGEVLIRVNAADLNPYDYMLSGAYGSRNPALPLTPGSDAAGVLESAAKTRSSKIRLE